MRQHHRPAHHLVGVLGVDAQTDIQVDGLVELGVLGFFDEWDCIDQGVGPPLHQRARLHHILGQLLCHSSLVSHRGRPAAAQAAPTRRPRIAVLDFDYGTVQSSTNGMFGSNVDVGKGITDLLITGLVKDGTFSIIERQALEKVMAEQNFSNSQRADSTSAAKLGKLLGVDAIIVGSITQFGNETKKIGGGGSGGSWGGYGLGGLSHSNSKANVGITARIVNVDTGEILAVAEGAGISSRSSTSMLGGGGHGWSNGAGNVNFGSSDFQATIIGEATKMAVDKLTADIVANASKVSVRTVTVEGLVAAVDGGQVILNVGKKAGVNAGDRLEVVRVTKEIKDPETGAVIRRLTSSIGIIKATDVDDNSAVCVPVSGSDFQTGDRVKSVAQCNCRGIGSRRQKVLWVWPANMALPRPYPLRAFSGEDERLRTPRARINPF
jgi:curli biogenesis system outer membrane secretion channel CsgG